MIYENPGITVLDPNGDGYVSKTKSGFISNDEAESEIPYVPIIFPSNEPNSDLGPGPDCGFSDFVQQNVGVQDAGQYYVDKVTNNWLFRIRLGGTSPNSKSYSILIDTDQKFGLAGSNADPNYVSGNPGFEIEIVLATNFSVSVYDIDGKTAPELKRTYAINTHFQKAIALTMECGTPDYFYDFFVSFSDLTTDFGITKSTPCRLVLVDNMAANTSSIAQQSSLSDIGGINDAAYGGDFDAAFGAVIDNYTPTCDTCPVNLDRSACPYINAPIYITNAFIAGTSTEATGTIIKVYKNGTLLGSTTVNSGLWNLSGISGLTTNDLITATATATGKGTSISNCNTRTVLSASVPCTVPDPSALVLSNGNKVLTFNYTGAGNTITLYDASNNTVWTGTGSNNPLTTTSTTSYTMGQTAGSNTVPTNFYLLATNGSCKSNKVFYCASTFSTTPTITSPVGAGSTSISGTCGNIQTAVVTVFKNNVSQGTATVTGTSWTKTGLTLAMNDELYVTSVEGTLCMNSSTIVKVTCTPSTTPAINQNVYANDNVLTGTCGSGATVVVYKNGSSIGNATVTGTTWSIAISGLTANSTTFYAEATETSKCTATSSIVTVKSVPVATITGSYCGNTSTVSGYISNTSGTLQLYKVGSPDVAIGSPYTLNSSTTWTVTGLSLTGGNQLYAKVTLPRGSTSTSSTITIETKTLNSVAITTTPIHEGTSTLSGTGTDGDLITLYTDGSPTTYTTYVNSGTWTISGIFSYDLYLGANVYVTATTPGQCESSPSSSQTVLCVPPAVPAYTGGSHSYCYGQPGEIIISNSVPGVIYQLVNGAGASAGPSAAGNGGSIVLYTHALTSNLTDLYVKAFKILNASCSVISSSKIDFDTQSSSPSITLTNSSTTVLKGTTSATLSYSSPLNNPTNYGIVFSLAAKNQGFADVPSSVLPASPITIAVPSGAAVGTYTGVLTISSGASCSSVYNISVVVYNTSSAPQFSIQPADKTICGGIGTSFNVEATGTPTSYQWQYSSDAGYSWNSLTNGGVYSGATTSTLSISNVTGLNGYKYNCIATNANGSNTSNYGSLTVLTNPGITSQPVSLSVCSGAEASFNIIQTNASSIKWQVDGGTGFADLSNSGVYSGATSGTLHISDVTGLNGYKYRAVVSNTCSSISSNAATLTVNSLPSAPTVGAISQPSCASATGSVELNGLPSGNWIISPSSGSSVSSSGSNYTFTGLTPLTTYTFTVTNSLTCTSSASSIVVVNANPTPPTAPSAVSVTQPTCGTPSGTIIFNTQAGVEYSVGAGFQSGTTFTDLSPAVYTLSVRNTSDHTCLTSSPATITINEIPTAPPVPTVLSVVQPTCAIQSGTILFDDLPNVQYSVGTGFQALPSFTGLTPGIYSLAVRSIADNTCITSAASTITINSIPSVPAVPTVLSITQPTCGIPSGTIAFNSQVGVEFSVGSGYQAGSSFASLNPGIYTLSVRSIADNSCITTAGSASTINAIPPPPSAPLANASQSFCNGINPRISDIVITGSNVTWYDAPSAGNVLASNTTLTNGTSYYASETASGCESLTRTSVAVTVLACTGPNIVDQTVNINENSSDGSSVYNVNDVNGTDKDIDGNTITYFIISGNSLGAFSINVSSGAITVNDGSVLDYETHPSLSIVVRATNGTVSNDATITIHLNNINDNNPVAIGDSYAVNEGGTLNVPVPGVLSNDYDPDGNSLTSIRVTDPANGVLTLNADGSFVYTHDGSETTVDAFTYKTNDGTREGNSVTVNITIHPVNDSPLVNDISKTVNEDESLSFAAIDFTSSYTDPESTPLAKIRIVSLPDNGILKLSGISVEVNDEILTTNTASLVFEPALNWNGTTSFGWKGSDGTAYADATAEVNITVSPLNDAPVLTDISKTGNEDDVVNFTTGDFSNAFADIDGNTLSKIKITSLPANGTLKLLGNNIDLNDEILSVDLGNLTFTPDFNWNGSSHFTWNGFDGSIYSASSANVNIQINAVNDLPLVYDITKNINEDDILSFSSTDFTGDFSDVDGNSLTKVKITSLPANGVLKLGGASISQDDEILLANLSFIQFVPNEDWNGNTSFSWNGFDGTAYAGSAATVNITVVPVNDLPVVSGISKTINEDNTLAFAATDFSSAYSDIEGNLLTRVKITSLPADGTLKLSGINVNVNDEIIVANLGNLVFIPDANWNGIASFHWNGSDGTGFATSDANFQIIVDPVNDAPTVSDIYKSTLTNATVSFTSGDFTAAYADAENNVLTKVKIVSLPSYGVLQLSGLPVSSGDEILTANLGNLAFIPNTGYNGNASFTWNGEDGSLYAASNADVNVSISAIPNTPPIVSNISKSGNEDQSIAFTSSDFSTRYSDSEGNVLTKIQVTSLPPHGTLKLLGVPINILDEISLASLDNITFVPDDDWNGSSSFTWNGFDGTVYANSDANVNITVNAANDPPVVSSMTKSVNEDNSLAFEAIDFTANYSDVESDPVSKIKITSLPLHGSLKLSGIAVTLNEEISTSDLENLSFISDANWHGNTSFGWNAFDGIVYANTDAAVNITVDAINDLPTVSDISKSIDEDNSLSFDAPDFTDKFSDVDGNALVKIKVISLPANGTLKLLGTDIHVNQEILAADVDKISFIPDINWHGSTSFLWNGFDGTLFASADASVNILVNPVNDAPIVSNVTKTGNEDNTMTFASLDFTSAYSDVDGNSLTAIKVISLPAHGTLKLSGVNVNLNDEITIALVGNLIFVPDPDWNGATSFNWNGFDGSVYANANAGVNITIDALNDPPTVNNITKTINEDNTLTFSTTDFAGVFTDIDGNSLNKVKILSLPAEGILKLSGVNVLINDEILAASLGNLVFVPENDWSGNISFNWNGFDGTAYADAEASVNISVTPLNDPPVVSDIYKSELTNTSVAFTISDFTGAYTDKENDAISKVKIISLPPTGSLKLSGVSINAGDEISIANINNLTYVPSAGWNGTASFEWNGSDGNVYALIDADVHITISATPNTPPAVSNIGKSVNEDNILIFAPTDFTAAFSDAEDNELTKIKITSLPANCTLKLSGIDVNINDEIPIAFTGNLTLIPDADWNGNISFEWTGFDGIVYANSSATVNITVLAINDRPYVSGFAKTVNEDVILAFEAVDFANAFNDPDGNAITQIMVTSLPDNGTLKLSGTVVNVNDVILTGDISNLIFVPDVNWNGNTGFSWNGFDGAAYAALDAQVTITVDPLNDPPSITNISKSDSEDNPYAFSSIDFTGAFSDSDGNSLVRIKIVSLPAHGILRLSGIDVNINDEILVADLDNLVFIPETDWNGTITFEWNGFDGMLYANSDATVSITIDASNDTPTVNSFSKSTPANIAIAFSLSDFTSAFADIENDALDKVKILTLPEGTLRLLGTDVNAGDEVTAANLANLTFIPNTGWNGSTSFKWNGSDGTAYANADAEVNITVLANHEPVIGNINKVGDEDNIMNFAATDFTAAYTDADGNELTKIKITSLPANGTLLLSGVAVKLNDEIPVSLLGSLTFVPDANWNGNTSFGWNGFDGISYSPADASLDITVNALNDAPVINSPTITQTMNEDEGTALLNVSANVSDPDGDELTVSISGNPAHGTASIDNNDNIIYTPVRDFNGDDTFTYQVCDNGSPALCSTGTATVTVQPVNDAPSLTSEIINETMTNNGGTKTIDLPGNIVNIDGDVLTTSIITNPKHGTAVLNETGQLVYTPASDFTGNDTIIYQVCDNGTPQLCATGKIVVTVKAVSPVNHAPVLDNLNKTIGQDQTLSFTKDDFAAAFTDADNDALVAIRFVTLPSNGSLLLNGVIVTINQEIPVADLDKLVFVPEQGFYGETSFTWEASDGKDYSATSATITIAITQSEVFIPEGFSPNGDGSNDFFIIKGADSFVVSLKVFNRWGNMVYESKHYKNDWDGFSNAGLILGTKLPDGTYYYIIDFNNGEKEKIGYITINR
jgi:gliding motility-associated-like protein